MSLLAEALIKEKSFYFTIYQFFAPPLLLLLLPCARSFSQPPASRHCMPIKRVAHLSKMAKKGTKKQALGWTSSAFKEMDLKKAKKEGFLAEFTEIVFPSTEVIPAQPARFWVMFLAFLLYGFSLPAHKFVRGASVCVRHAAVSAHAKFSSAHCLLHLLCVKHFCVLIPTGFFGNICFA
jgi:hypothetical protein